MTLSSPRRNDLWRRAAKTPSAVLSGRYDLPFPWSTEPVTLDIKGSVALIAGLNATGKSRSLEALVSQLDDGASILRLHELCEWLRRSYESRPDLIEGRDEYEALELTADELGTVSSVVGRRYQQVKWYALEIEDAPFEKLIKTPVMPLMEVQYGGHPYFTPDMGLGELSIHLAFWLLKYLIQAPPPVLLLDEPDAFLPDRSAEVLASEVLAWSGKTKTPVVMTTHCHELALIAGRHESLHILSRTNGRAKCLSGRAAFESLRAAYAGPSRMQVLTGFCEDEAAAAVLDELWHSIAALPPTEFTWVKGTGSLDNLRKEIPGKLGRFLYCYDGDQRDRVQAGIGSGIIFLPLANPDSAFRSAVQHDVSAAADFLGIKSDILQLRLETLEVADDHDWTNGLLDLSFDRRHALRLLARMVVSRLEEEVRNEFTAEVRNAVSVV